MAFHTRSHTSYKIQYSQNFFRSSRLAREVVDLAHLSKSDNIIEIGSGKGALTRHLSDACGNLIAIEKDADLYLKLSDEFLFNKNTKIIHADFLNWQLPEVVEYKIVSNIPFALTADILKKVLETDHVASEIYLILQKEAAIRFLGSDYLNSTENLFSLRFKPFFKGEIIKHFKREDFKPIPHVDIVMLRIQQRFTSLIQQNEKAEYLDFLTYCFCMWKKNMQEILSSIFTYNQIQKLKHSLDLNLNTKPSEVPFKIWLALFEIYQLHAKPESKDKVRNSFNKLQADQNRLQKIHRTM